MYHDELYHYGILGQKWGVRRFQNPDGSLTGAGKKRYGVNPIMSLKKAKTKFKRKRALKKARKTKAQKQLTEEALAEKKNEWAKSPKTLAEHIDDYSNAEIAEAIARLKLTEQVADMKYQRVKRGADYVTQFGNAAKGISEIANMAKNMKKAYDALFPSDDGNSGNNNNSNNNNGGKKQGKKQGNNNGVNTKKDIDDLKDAISELTDRLATVEDKQKEDD